MAFLKSAFPNEYVESTKQNASATQVVSQIEKKLAPTAESKTREAFGDEFADISRMSFEERMVLFRDLRERMSGNHRMNQVYSKLMTNNSSSNLTRVF